MHQKSDALTDENVPIERDSIALVVTDTKKSGAAYYTAKHLLEYVFEVLGVKVEYRPLDASLDATYAPYEPKRSALVADSKTGTLFGVVGEFKKSVQKAFKTPEFAAVFEIDPRKFLESSEAVGIQYQPLSRYPGTERDICFQVSRDIRYSDIVNAADAYLQTTQLISTVDPLDMYEPQEGDTKNITIRVGLSSYEKTLTNEEVTDCVNKLIDAVIDVTKGKVI